MFCGLLKHFGQFCFNLGYRVILVHTCSPCEDLSHHVYQDVFLCKALKYEYSVQIYEYLIKVLTPRLLIHCFDLIVFHTVELYP